MGTERFDAGVLRCDVVCTAEHEGGPGVAHGGWTAAVLDEVLGHVAPQSGVMAVTGTITVRYHKPAPLERPLVARAWVDDRSGLKWSISGDLVLASSGAPLASASGVWVQRDPVAHFTSFREWLGREEGETGPAWPDLQADTPSGRWRPVSSQD